ncbi:hypothetical protein [Streptomyces sp. NPDC060194]|uniref:hypothetical protein n=1 Tax=Streptomyces sp. NPDC060194 TaxID=3347069 RepID=UPI003663D7B4
MVAVGQGNVLASRLIHRSHTEADWFLYAPTCALVDAERARPGTAEHLAALPGIVVLDLDLPAALAVARDTSWGHGHTLHAALPTPDRPNGAIVATAAPDRWTGRPVRLYDLNP